VNNESQLQLFKPKYMNNDKIEIVVTKTNSFSIIFPYQNINF